MEEISDGRLARGARARAAILASAADIASAEGLEGLSIARLAQECGTSKSNVAAHFGSKAQLQLAAVDYAGEVFTTEVIAPALTAPKGMPRLLALYRQWMDYSRRRVFSGGCFFAAVTAEYDARDGALRDALRERRLSWLGLQQQLVREAQAAGEIGADLDPVQLVFELDAFAVAANSQAVLFDDDTAYDRATAAITSRIDVERTRVHEDP
ncbi:TetR/AcrR family transcriptional regulator [Mycolicibacterium brisbanense]|uniref:Transcriptional regulator, TetR family n=1 Tax=Mycolicibacterium brisbanense TaxID=146020 RepID=A0A100W1L0_9MYCO|nr:TetR/AcrR family transcriptional regulator [Mycolicibacterium brisbanense]MCV7160009.1 TetR/AcrR family transcriptional regulator [Mycolicibacterium brisbanense]GAS89811.1 transcriptional regulator, TetR family [Mycolicibacterium brisbanense]